MISYQLLQGSEIEPYLDVLASLRISVFKEYPYLYDGDKAYEEKYLKRYLHCPNSLVALASHDGEVVGATTCLPLSSESVEISHPFQTKGYDLNQIFYFGESVILPEFRGRKIGHQFFKIREHHAAQVLGDQLQYTCFCAVEREDCHPLRDKQYKPLDAFWGRMGYKKTSQLSITYPWKDIGKEKEDEKKLTFWLKAHS